MELVKKATQVYKPNFITYKRDFCACVSDSVSVSALIPVLAKPKLVSSVNDYFANN